MVAVPVRNPSGQSALGGSADAPDGAVLPVGVALSGAVLLPATAASPEPPGAGPPARAQAAAGRSAVSSAMAVSKRYGGRRLMSDMTPGRAGRFPEPGTPKC